MFERIDEKGRNLEFIKGVDSFNNTYGVDFNSPYISWENLNHYGDREQEDYLKTAVQKGKKLCAGIIFNNAEEMINYIKKIDREKYDYAVKSWNDGAYINHKIDLVRKGSLSSYFKLVEIGIFYRHLGLGKYKKYISIDRFNELFFADLYDLINGKTEFDYCNPCKTIEENIITGLMLGYPLESTMDYMFNSEVRERPTFKK